MSDVLEILKRGDNSLEALLRAVLLDSDNKVPAERLRIVGAIADGAIMEAGSNANGYWVKFADGTLVCYHSFSTTNVPELKTVGALFCFQYLNITLPHVFVNSSYNIVGGTQALLNDSPSYLFAATGQGNTSTIRIMGFESRNLAWNVLKIAYIAIGRWKA